MGKQQKKKNKKKQIQNYSAHGTLLISYSVLLLICYMMPLLKVEVSPDVTGYDNVYYLPVSLYNFVFAKNYHIGNIQYLLQFITTIILLITGLILKNNYNKKIYLSSFIVLIASLLLSVVMSINIFKNGIDKIAYGLIIFIILTCVYYIMFLIRNLKLALKK